MTSVGRGGRGLLRIFLVPRSLSFSWSCYLSWGVSGIHSTSPLSNLGFTRVAVQLILQRMKKKKQNKIK